MMDSEKNLKRSLTVKFPNRKNPRTFVGSLAGYAALIQTLNLDLPPPLKMSIINLQSSSYRVETPEWLIFPAYCKYENNLIAHLYFAIRYEPVNFPILKAVFQKINPAELELWIKKRYAGRFTRRIWFLYEWLMEERLNLPDSTFPTSIDLLDPKKYYVAPYVLSERHRVRNNLPGVREFCPLIRRTEKLDTLIAHSLNRFTNKKNNSTSLPKDLSLSDLFHLQSLIIKDQRFAPLGLRNEEDFIEGIDETSGNPLPIYIAARSQDLPSLMGGMIKTYNKLKDLSFNPVLRAALISFGFVFVHPFRDGNGRLHRHLIGHILRESGEIPDKVIASIPGIFLRMAKEYQQVLESYSRPRLGSIKWKPTSDGNIKISNDTSDLYRYFDATESADFLYEFLLADKIFISSSKYNCLKEVINKNFTMPNHLIAFLVSSLRQHKGKLPQEIREKVFKDLSEQECRELEKSYKDIFESLDADFLLGYENFSNPVSEQ